MPTNSKNNGNYSRLSVDPTLGGMVDGVDFPHTGVFKALAIAAQGNFAILNAAVSSTTENFSIVQTGGGTSQTQFTVGSGMVMRDGKAILVPSNSNTTVFNCGTTSPAHFAEPTSTGSGYFLLVAQADNTLAIRDNGNKETLNTVPQLTAGDIPIAMIRLAFGDNNEQRLIQYFTTAKSENSVSVGYNASTVYTETMSVIGDGDRTTFKNKIANADIRFVLADNTADEKFEILTDDDSDGDEGDTSVFSVDGLGAIAAGNLTYDQDDMVLSSAAAQLQVKDTTNNYAVTIKGGGGPRIQMGDTDSSVDTFMDIGAYGGINNIDTQSRDFKIHGGTHATHFYIDESAANVGIGVAPITNSKLTVEGVLALDEVSAPTNTADYGQLYANADNDLHYMDGAGTNTPLLKGGTHSIWVPAEAISPRNNAGCADLTLTAAATNGRPDIRGLAFDGASREHAQFTIAMPKMWDGGNVTARFYWTTIASGTGDVMWAIRGVSLSNDDAIDTAFGSLAVTAPDGVIATKDVHITDETGACTIAGSPAALDLCCFEVVREGDQSNDTLNSVDCVLLGVKLFYTIDKGNDA